MSVSEILPDLFFVERGYLNGNHFIYRSKAPILIDTAYVCDFEVTARLIRSLGVRLSDISLIINTHCHCDHIGGNKSIQDQSGCEIALHTIGKYFIDTRDDWSTWWKYYHQQAEFFKATRPLEDGDVVAVGPHEFEVLHTPGHASDGIVLYNRRAKILLSSDTLWENDMAVLTVRVEGSAAVHHMLQSLERIEALDVHTVFPGHGKPFADIKRALSKAKKRTQRYLENRQRLGMDLLKKIMIYTLLMLKKVDQDTFFQHLAQTHWFKETVDLYFNGAYQAKYAEILNGLLERKIVVCKSGQLFTTVKP
ncbi:MAG: MBL fold metallo-hydrolase [Desulfobacterales bacterium]|nr:MAG: MBL fold metallo-hydrolase [Desulfobacterales bacterium]